MDRRIVKLVAALGALAVLAIAVTIFTEVRAQEPSAVDPEAAKLLRRSTEYLSGLQQFSVRARNMHEDLLDSGHKIHFGGAGSLTVSRPNKLRGERHGARFNQTLYYDGKTVTLANSPDNVYASEPAPGTIPEMFTFAHETLELYIPITDLIWPDVFPLLMEDVTMAMVLGKMIVGDVTCDHLLFSRPGVDFEIWIADSGPPLPFMFIVTDTGTPEKLSVVTTMSDWDVDPTVPEGWFTFVPPEGATEVPFLKPVSDQGPIR
jgi:hypothetical protein